MRILFLATNLPVRADNGQALRSLSVLRALASSAHRLCLISFAGKRPPDTLDPLSSYCEQIDLVLQRVANLSERSGYLNRAACMLSRKPYSLERFRSLEMRARIQAHLNEEDFDLIVADGLYAMVNIPQTEVPIVLNCHNVEYVIFERFANLQRNPAKKWYASLESKLVRSAEKQGCGRASVAMVCSDVDGQKLRQLCPNLPISVVPNSVDVDFYFPSEREESGDPDPVLLFQGSMDWYPNRDAVDFFAKAILPAVRTECPAVKFVIAGRNPPADFVSQLNACEGVEFTGTVPDMRRFLASAAVVVVPLRLGSGTRIKILEACTAGKATVSTSVGAEGLELEHDQEIILADGPKEFARSVISLLQNPAKRRAIGRSARARIVERYSHLVLKRSLDSVISGVAGVDAQAAVWEEVR